ncbi:MAG: hypothetical protein JWM76_1781 [Pseudonocardiales bacterium]|nr:hypothetical protein [Pseudonocardiales bacterium]
MAGLERLADRELGAMETLFVMGDSEVGTRSTVIMLVRLDQSVDFDTVVRIHERASRLVSHLRRKVVAPVLPVSRPFWMIDPDFDLTYHVRHVRVPGDGTERDFLELVESIGQVPVDSARPLWDVTSVEGLADGTGALIYKFHHAISDGEGAKQIFARVFPLLKGEPTGALPPLPAAEDVTRVNVTRQRISELPLALAWSGASSVRGVLSAGVGAIRHPRSSVTSTASYLQSLQRTMAGPTSAPSPLLQRRGLRRRYATLDIRQADLQTAAKAIGVSLNSAYVAGVVGGIARYHDALNSPIDEISVAMPVSVRRPEDKIEENHFVAARIAVPASGSRTAERAQLINTRVRAARDEPALDAVTRLAPVMSRVPLWLTTTVMGNVGQVELQISNIPGYTQPTYFGDARVTGYFGFGPLAGAAMMVVLNSADGVCHIAFNMDADAIKEPHLMLKCVEEEFAEVLALAKT